MWKLFRTSIYKVSIASLRLVISLFMTLFAGSVFAQVLFDSSNLIFEITTPTDTSITLFRDNEASDEENLALLKSIAGYKAAINNIQLTVNDSYNFELLEEYTSLGDAYRSLGQHEEAISHYDSAMQISKINGGLYNLDQLPLLEKIIQSYLALGDIDNAGLWHEYSHYLHLENYDAADPEMVNATFSLTKWYIANFFRSNFQSPNQNLQVVENQLLRTTRATSAMNENDSLINGFMANPNNAQFENILNGNIRGVTPRDIEHPLLLKVGSIYEDLQENIYAADQPDVGSIVQTARRIAELSFITKQEMDFERQNPNLNLNYANSRVRAYRNSQQRMDQSYNSGRNALEYIVTLLRAVEARPGFLGSALIELGDWHLAYGKIPAAQTAYEDAYRVMVEDMGMSAEAVSQAFNSPVPYQIPRMATHMFTRKSAGLSNDIDLDYQGYFDVGFTIDSQGNADDIVFLASNMDDVQNEQDTTEDLARRIRSLIQSKLKLAKFRPYFNQQTLVSPGQVKLRYYYAFAD